MILYADTSSLVKLYLVEERSVEIRQSSLAADEVICSKITYAETRVAFARALRDQRINQTEFRIGPPEVRFRVGGSGGGRSE